MTFTVVSASEQGDLTELESVALRVFGEGDRPPGWFSRKLVRECVDAELSRVAIDERGRPLGYVLVGRPPSWRPRARTSGTGVVPEHRGQGVGTALLRSAAVAATAAGCSALVIPSEAHRVSYYGALGFIAGPPVATLLAFGRGHVPWKPLNAKPWALPLHPAELCGWLEEAWERTPADLRSTVERDGVGMHVAREGQALVIHRLLSARNVPVERIVAALDDLLDAAPRGAPVCLVGVRLAAESGAEASTDGPLASDIESLVRPLLGSGWVVAQRSVPMTLRLDGR